MGHLLTLCIAAICCLTASPQTPDDESRQLPAEAESARYNPFRHSRQQYGKHEFGLMFGGGGIATNEHASDRLFDRMYALYAMDKVENKYDGVDKPAAGHLVLNTFYRYYPIERLGIGIDLGFAPHWTYEMYRYDFHQSAPGHWKYDKTVTGKLRQWMLFAMPEVKYVWLNTNSIQLYVKAGIGAGIHYLRYSDDDSPVRHRHSETHWRLAYQATPLAIQIGRKHVRGIVEVGYGYEGIVAAGVSYSR